MKAQKAEEIGHSWILIKLNPIEEENMWQNPDLSVET